MIQNEPISVERIAIYSQDGFGLGHMRRTSSIALQMCQMHPNANILTLSDSPLGQFFPTSANHDYVKLPSIVKSGPGDWKASKLTLSTEEILKMRQQIIVSALTSYAPHILLVDHMPHGAMGELIPALDALKYSGIGTQVVLGIRDILDDPQVVINRWTIEGAYDAVEQYYDRVLIYGMKDVYDVVTQYKFPDSIADRVRYCGYVCNPAIPTSAAEIRARHLAGTSANTRFVVAMAGGGADAYPMMSALVDMMVKMQNDQPTVLVLITGPFMSEPLIADLKQRAQGPVIVVESVNDTLSYISAADLTIAMAGYNTSAEILRMKKPAILIPRDGPSAEQRTRASLFAARRWVDTIMPEELTPDFLRHKVIGQLKGSLRGAYAPITRPDLHGVMVAANQILALLLPNQEKVFVGQTT